MAVPPTYVDLGKSAKDVFTKGYGKHQEYSLSVEYIIKYNMKCE